jgi:hypothetical protein
MARRLASHGWDRLATAPAIPVRPALHSPTVKAMSVVTTQEIHRKDDDELIGLLLASDDQWIPATVFGGVLAPATSRSNAEEIVRTDGLSSMANSWWMRRRDGAWEEIWLLEVHADRIRVSDCNPNYGTVGAQWVTVTDVELQRDRPVEVG